MVSDEQLSSLNAFEIPEGEVTPSAADKKQKLEEWANFPLRSREDLMTWRDERLSKDPRYESPAESDSVDPDVAMSIEASDGGSMDRGGTEEGMDGLDQGMHQGISQVATETFQSFNPIDHIQAAEFENYLPPVDSGHSSAATVTMGTLPGSGMLGLSKEFQDTFLW